MNSAEYLGQLEQQLTKRISDEFASRCFRELEGHLLAARAAYEELGENATEAERRAILDLGPVRLVARDLARQYRDTGRQDEPALGMALLFGLFLSYGFVSFALAYGFYSFAVLSAMPSVMLCCSAAIVGAIGWRTWKTRRWLVRPLLGWISGAVIAVLAVSLFADIRRAETSRASGEQARMIRESENALLRDRAAVMAWRQGAPPLTQGPSPVAYTQQTFLPLVPWAFSWVGSSEPSLTAMAAKTAKRAWATHGEAFAQTLPMKEEQLARQKSVNFAFVAENMVRNGGSALVFLLAIVTAWNGLFLALAAAFDRLEVTRFRRRLG
jgi:hypothetical protein